MSAEARAEWARLPDDWKLDLPLYYIMGKMTLLMWSPLMESLHQELPHRSSHLMEPPCSSRHRMPLVYPYCILHTTYYILHTTYYIQGASMESPRRRVSPRQI